MPNPSETIDINALQASLKQNANEVPLMRRSDNDNASSGDDKDDDDKKKTVPQLMQTIRTGKETIENTSKILDTANHGGLSALNAYANLSDYKGTVLITKDDAHRELEIRHDPNRHISEDHFVMDISPGKPPEQALQEQKDFLKKVLPNVDTEVTIVHDDNGKTYLGIMGISGDQENGVYNLWKQQQKASKETAQATQQLQDITNSHQPDKHDNPALVQTQANLPMNRSQTQTIKI